MFSVCLSTGGGGPSPVPNPVAGLVLRSVGGARTFFGTRINPEVHRKSTLRRGMRTYRPLAVTQQDCLVYYKFF